MHEKYCFCRCPICQGTKHEWIEFAPNSPSFPFTASVYCDKCRKIVEMTCIESELSYLW